MTAGSLSFDAFLARRSSDRRLARLTHDIRLPSGKGLEFGAGANPTPLPQSIDVTYLDHAKDAAADLPGAVAVDHAWTGSGSLADVLAREGFDFAIGAQVAQYVPNLLGWLRGIHDVLRPGGVLNLSFPDKRFMFDAGRPASTLAELVEAEVLGYEQPSPRQLFAHASEARSISPDSIWNGDDPACAPRMAGADALGHAYAQIVQAMAEKRYVLCHCWVFTPASLLDRLADATRLGLFPYVLNQISSTEPGGFEFFVSMRRTAQKDTDTARDEQNVAIDHLRRQLERRRLTATLLAD